MKPVTFEFGSKTLELNLTGQATVDIEKQIGKSLLGIMMTSNGGFKMPRLGEMLIILHSANMNHGIKMKDMPALYDEYISGGGSMTKLMETIQDLMEKAGFFESDEDEPEEEADKKDTSLV
ncbi:hypothetical protein JZO81_19410 [Enterococcus hulanensis]|uniref:DUF6096 family protein n=1 Tax=Enterococcus TaxID=1350 RepID=UPI000B5A54DF|nr:MULTISPECIES: DUF6096 family protein [Enterococcus]MBO0413229.1 hypothetical protein [Enterococcus hulanensis]OTO15104.1 hypothetical protein A5875_004261 [Enterococcus sp. 3H8_DIV0648]